MDVPVLGRTLSLRGIAPDLARWLRTYWDYPEHRLPTHPYTVVVEVEEGEVTPAERHGSRRHRLPVFDFELDVVSFPGGFRCDTDPGAVTCLHGPDTTTVRVRPTGAFSAPLGAAMNLGVKEALRVSGLVPLHAAATRSARGVTLYLGPSGAGKSTTMLRALRAGALPVAEDFVWCDAATFTAYGWDRELRLLPGSLAFLPDGLDVDALTLHPDGKRAVSYGSVAPEGAGRAGPVSRVVVLRPEAGDPTAEAGPATRTLALALWEAAGFPLDAGAQRVTADFISRLGPRVQFESARARAYEVTP
ncbi:hypothetical protein [Deinococcus pimensis]|uniref:hypothetical protein n=1 Tax=Deinococcus pimensis TaxID=309888 RepID=UPI0005EBD7BC|nr:hypothetical protein [Deinococcus pimensis]